MIRLTVITGNMFAGKSLRILSELSRASDVYGGRGMYITHSFDERPNLTSSQTSAVSSHSKLAREGFSSAQIHVKTSSLYSLIGKIPSDVVALGIDEAQFFDADDLVNSVKCWVSTFNPTKEKTSREILSLRCIFVAGLDGDANQQPFPGSGIPRLLPLCDEFKKLTSAVCLECIREFGVPTPAPFTIKTPLKTAVTSCSVAAAENASSFSSVDIGGADKYMAVCRNHIRLQHTKME